MKITQEQLTEAVAEIDRILRNDGMHYSKDFREVEDLFCEVIESHFGELVDRHPVWPLFMVLATFEALQHEYCGTDEDAKFFCITPEDYDDYESFCVDLDEKWYRELSETLVEAEEIILSEQKA